MNLLSDATISPRLLQHLLTSCPGGGSEFQDDPRRLLDVYNNTGDAEFKQDRDRAAHMLLHLDNPQRILELGLEHLVDVIGAARGDAGLADVADASYRPSVVVSDEADAQARAVLATPLPNRHSVLQAAWSAVQPISFTDVSNDPRLGSLSPVFRTLGTSSMLASSITCDGFRLGLLCVDEVDGQRNWSERSIERMRGFITLWLAPILLRSLIRQESQTLTPAERVAVSLLAEGLTYVQIARALGKSPRTIDNQLRSARRKFGVHNTAALLQASGALRW